MPQSNPIPKGPRTQGFLGPFLRHLREHYVEHRVSWGDEVVIEVGSILRVEGGQAGGVAEFPLVGEPGVEVAGGPGRFMRSWVR